MFTFDACWDSLGSSIFGNSSSTQGRSRLPFRLYFHFLWLCLDLCPSFLIFKIYQKVIDIWQEIIHYQIFTWMIQVLGVHPKSSLSLIIELSIKLKLCMRHLRLFYCKNESQVVSSVYRQIWNEHTFYIKFSSFSSNIDDTVCKIFINLWN